VVGSRMRSSYGTPRTELLFISRRYF
jgi:hypothetical protein